MPSQWDLEGGIEKNSATHSQWPTLQATQDLMRKEAGRGVFWGEKCWRATRSPFPTSATPPRLRKEGFKGSTDRDRMLARIDNWPRTGDFLSHRNPRAQNRMSRENLGNPGTGTWLLWLEILQTRDWLKLLWHKGGKRSDWWQSEGCEFFCVQVKAWK